MFTADFYIDSFQTGKKQLIDAFVTHEGLKSVLKDFVDSQTEYTKAAVKSGTDIGTRFIEETVNGMFAVSRLDFTNFTSKPSRRKENV